MIIPFDFTDDTEFIRLNLNSDGYYVVDYSYNMLERLNNDLFANDGAKWKVVTHRVRFKSICHYNLVTQSLCTPQNLAQ